MGDSRWWTPESQQERRANRTQGFSVRSADPLRERAGVRRPQAQVPRRGTPEYDAMVAEQQARQSDELRRARVLDNAAERAQGPYGTGMSYLDPNTPNLYGPLAEMATAVMEAPDYLRSLTGDAEAAQRVAGQPARALELSNDLRSVGEFLIGPEEVLRMADRLGTGEGDALDAIFLPLTVAPGPTGRAFKRFAADPIRTGARRARQWLRGAEEIAPAVGDAVRPSYAVREEGPALRVEREGLQREANPALAEGSIADLRVRMADPAQNAALRLANEEAMARTGQPLDLTNLPQTSLRRQGGIARMFDAATEGSPDYKSALFEQYGLQMPQVVEQAGAQNYDQLTEAAYRQLADEAQQQFDRLPVGMNYHYGELEYPTPSAMFRDALGRGELNVFRGGDPHPFLSGIDPATGLTGNEQFRAVHDYVGHGASGSTFRPGGEEIAYATHAQTLSPLAQMALLSETRGQNSWVNYSPANVDLIAQMEGIRGQLAGVGGSEADALRRQLRELGGEFQYAAQEPVLLPPEYLAVNSEGGVPDWAQRLIVPRAPVSARGVHYSRAEGLQRTDPSFYGTGHIGEERRMVRREGLPDRTYFYAQGADGTLIRPEEPVAQRAPYIYDADLQGLYDVNADPERLSALANLYNRDGSALPDLERLIQQYGYSGYISDYAPSWAPQSRRAAAMFEPVDVRPR